MGRGGGLDRAGYGPIEVALLSDDDSVRRALAAVVAEHGLRVTVEASDPGQIVDTENVDCIVVHELEDAASYGSIRRLRKALPSTPVVSIAKSVGRRTVAEAFDAGADGIVLEDQIDEQLPAALHAVCSGQLSLPRELRASFAKPRLSPREKQILAMVVMAYTNREIANTLYLAESTVKTHLSSAFEKLGVRSRSEAAALILDSSQGLGTGILSIVGEEAAVVSPAS
jgi:DNA-binding NarL/FixJ family response regulator